MKRQTSRQILDEAAVHLELLKHDLESFLRGEWRYEYFYTIAYNKVYTGKKVYTNSISIMGELDDRHHM